MFLLLRFLLAFSTIALASSAGAEELKAWRGGATPALELKDLRGETHRLADYRGKVVLVNFWATWCDPCREEMPSMERLRGSLAGRPFEVLGVNLGESPSRIERFLEKLPLSFPLLLDRDSAVSKAWRARILPASFLVDREGRVRYAHVGELDWSSDEVRGKVADLLK
jgi:peroxiredoxin